MGLNKKGGIITWIIVVAAVFLVGTFFGYQILARWTGVDFSPDGDVSDNQLKESCLEIRDLIKNEVCDVAASIQVGGSEYLENVEGLSGNGSAGGAGN